MVIFTTFNNGIEYLVNTETGERTAIGGTDWSAELEAVGDGTFTPRESNVVQFTPAEEAEEVPLFEPGAILPPETVSEVEEPVAAAVPIRQAVPQEELEYYGQPGSSIPAVTYEPPEVFQPEVYLEDLDVGSETDPEPVEYLGDLDVGSIEDAPIGPWSGYMGSPQWPEYSPPEQEEEKGGTILGWTPPDLSVDLDDIPLNPFTPVGPTIQDAVDDYQYLADPVSGFSNDLGDWWEDNRNWVVPVAIGVGALVLVLALR